MKTTVRDWYLVRVIDENKEPETELIWGIVIDDELGRYQPGDYVCTSPVINIDKGFASTKSGNFYELVGSGDKYTASFNDWLLLRKGYSPAVIVNLNYVKGDE